MSNQNGKFRKKKVYFTQVSNAALRDSNLTLKAKGLYSLIQSYITMENFILYKNTLLKQCKEKETSFNSAWKELKDNGYLIQYKFKNEKGVFIYEYELIDNPTVENPGVENPHVENPPGGKLGWYNNTDLNNTDLNNTNCTTQQVVSSKNIDYIEAYTHLKLSNNMKKEVSKWDSDRLEIAVIIFNSENGKYFSFLKKIYNDDGNFTKKNTNQDINPKSFNNFPAREYDYNDLEKKLLGWDKE